MNPIETTWLNLMDDDQAIYWLSGAVEGGVPIHITDTKAGGMTRILQPEEASARVARLRLSRHAPALLRALEASLATHPNPDESLLAVLRRAKGD